VTAAPPHPIATRFAAIMAGLRAAVAAACGRPLLAGPLVLLARRPLPGPLALRLHERLGKMMQEFAALVARVVAFGADAPPRPPRRKPAPRPDAAAPIPRVAAPDPSADRSYWIAAAAAAAAADAPGAARPEPPPRAPRPPRLPGNFGWLLGMSSATAIAGSQLAYLLTDPDMLALLRASPQLVQMLRPLCRMLGVALPAEFQPPPPPPGAEPKPPRRRRRRLWRPPSRRSDMLSLVRMGTPLSRS